MLENILEFIRPELFIIIIFLYCVGLFLKKAPWFKEEWKIPYIILFISIIITTLYNGLVVKQGFKPPILVACFIQSVIIAAITVFGNELIKQVTLKKSLDIAGIKNDKSK